MKMNGKELDEAFGKTVLASVTFFFLVICILGLFQFGQIIQWVWLNVSITVK
jgi:hypothetical protein